ncbi:uncharacterized protein LOC121835560 [Ixodes scapularis]|uniref:uncharacterized protein LOC121835560 n=1 Tax=Ixodes scapularis TaxID=6945 RepID=UPI001C388361|nr:uncharacterized protein LOC121835560 [Ixodes scapularis]
MKKTQPNSEDNICLAMSGLNKSLSRKKLTSSSSSLVLKYRTKAQVLDSAPDETSPKPRVVPHNKKMEEQPRCFPTKKKRPGSGPMHGKPPTSLEQQHIMEGLVASQEGVTTGDHKHEDLLQEAQSCAWTSRPVTLEMSARLQGDLFTTGLCNLVAWN